MDREEIETNLRLFILKAQSCRWGLGACKTDFTSVGKYNYGCFSYNFDVFIVDHIPCLNSFKLRTVNRYNGGLVHVQWILAQTQNITQ